VSTSRRFTDTRDIGEGTVVRLLERVILQDAEIQGLGDDLFRQVDERGRRKVLVSFEGVVGSGTAFLGKVITLHRKLQAVGGRMLLCGLNTKLAEVFQITKLDRILSVIDRPGLTTTADVAAEVFGPPAPAPFLPEWRTDTAVLLAKRIRDGAEYTTMPILADALQDAGCDSDDILGHLRGPGTHVRECWALDLILGPVAK
jgi:anti-sigma B factor antagonist